MRLYVLAGIPAAALLSASVPMNQAEAQVITNCEEDGQRGCILAFGETGSWKVVAARRPAWVGRWVELRDYDSTAQGGETLSSCRGKLFAFRYDGWEEGTTADTPANPKLGLYNIRTIAKVSPTLRRTNVNSTSNC